jgi:cytochrome c biogenesis protein CcdA/peroxiredoxin
MLDYVIAAVAGFVSFISPCVLPLVPAYIGYMGGRITNKVSAQVAAVGEVDTGPTLTMRLGILMHGIAFVAGFTFIFVTLGILGTAFVREVGGSNISEVEGLIGRVGGVLIIAFGLHFMGAIPAFFKWLRKNDSILKSSLTSVAVIVIGLALIAWGFTGTLNVWETSQYPAWAGFIALIAAAVLALTMVMGDAFVQPEKFWNKTLNTLDYAFYADTRRQITAQGNQGLSSSALMGVVFAAGWTPCIGPTLGLAMTMAANGGDVANAAALMTAYSLGLGIPFLLTALMLDSASGMLRRLKSNMNTIKVVSGAFLVVIGFSVASGGLQDLSARFNAEFGDVSLRLEHCTVGVVEGDIRVGQYVNCVTGEEDFETLRTANETAELPTDTINTASLPSISGGLPEADLPEVGLSVGELAPDFQTTNLDGETVSLSDYRGQTVLLNFWFTACGPCRIEMPHFQETFEKHEDFVVVAVNREESASTVSDFAGELGLNFPMLLDEDSTIQDLYGIVGYPSTFILDTDGVIVSKPIGLITPDRLNELLDEAMS